MFLNVVHHVAIIVSDYEKSREFYVEKLELPIIRENYRESRDDYKLDLQVGDIELEIFGVKNPQECVNWAYLFSNEYCFITFYISSNMMLRIERISSSVIPR